MSKKNQKNIKSVENLSNATEIILKKISKNKKSTLESVAEKPAKSTKQKALVDTIIEGKEPAKRQKSSTGSNNIIKILTLPLRDSGFVPFETNTILVGRQNSIISVEVAKGIDNKIFVATQANSESDEFSKKNLLEFGCISNIIESIKTNDNNVKAIITADAVGKILDCSIENGLLYSTIELLEDKDETIDLNGNISTNTAALMKNAISSFVEYCEIEKKPFKEKLIAISKIKSANQLAFIISANITLRNQQKQEILSCNDAPSRLFRIIEILRSQIEIRRTEEKIHKKIQDNINKHQKKLYLDQQIKIMKEELGQEEKDEGQQFLNQLKKIKISQEAKDKVKSEVVKLEKMNPFSSESGIIRSYIEWLMSLPWGNAIASKINITDAKKLLDLHHYGLEKIKERILEFIAVQIKSQSLKGPILCLVGAPGVGKTSLAKSIAESLNRKYIKISLAGLRDEAEIRGHRRTYIGSMPGKIIQSMKKAGAVNPLILLDEIDKMSSDFRGDPSSALLEVLDPEQNQNFSDHYLEVDYDLSKVMFVATANSTSNIPAPLKDRMEIIKISGYTENEKLHIAQNHLIPTQNRDHSLAKTELEIKESAIIKLIRSYTFESGVRNLNREIANLSRKAVKLLIENKDKKITIDESNLEKFAGQTKYQYGVIKEQDQIGVTTGLAYTEYGGDLLDIEALKFDGNGKIQITGKLGDVMKESAQAALSYTRSIGSDLKIDLKKFKNYDFHIHVPEGATPKDGPSAGVALCVSLVSVITGNKVRKDVAMTGEITLSGKILAIGGLKEKLLAASRGGIKTVLIPSDNKKDLVEMPKEITEKLEIIPVSYIKEALNLALAEPFGKFDLEKSGLEKCGLEAEKQNSKNKKS